MYQAKNSPHTATRQGGIEGGAYFRNSRHQERKWPPSSSPRTQGESKTSPHTYKAKDGYQAFCSQRVCDPRLVLQASLHPAGRLRTDRRLWWQSRGHRPLPSKEIGAAGGQPSLPPRTRGGCPEGAGGGQTWLDTMRGERAIRKTKRAQYLARTTPRRSPRLDFAARASPRRPPNPHFLARIPPWRQPNPFILANAPPWRPPSPSPFCTLCPLLLQYPRP